MYNEPQLLSGKERTETTARSESGLGFQLVNNVKSLHAQTALNKKGQ